MSLRFADSFDHYATSDLLSKWTNGSFGGGGDFNINTVNQRTGRACGAITRIGIFKTIDNQRTWIFGAAMQWAAFGGGISFNDIGNEQVFCTGEVDGTFSVKQGPFGFNQAVTLGRSDPSTAITLGRYFYLEFKVFIDISSGFAELRLNGQVILSLSGVRTQVTSANTADVVNVFGPGGGAQVFVDDLYVCDTNGTTNNDYLGDVQIGLIIPNGAGDFTQWTPTGGANFSNVNEVPPDGDATYNSSASVNQIDTYNFQDVDPARVIKAIQTNIFARKNDEGNRSLSVVSRLGGNNFVADPGGRFTNLTYIDYLNQFDVNPSTGLAWTTADLNAGQWGVKLIS